MLSIKDVIPYLVKFDLIAEAALVKGSVLVEEVSRRNCNYRVTCSEGQSYLLKQALGRETIDTLANEARFYEMTNVLRGDSELLRHIPRLFRFDPNNRVLILELIQNAEDLRQLHVRTGQFSSNFAHAIGRALAAAHRAPLTVLGATDWGGSLGTNSPWILSIQHPDLEIFRDISSANLALIKTIQDSASFGNFLDQIRRDWHAVAVTHHDMKWDNIVIGRSHPQRPHAMLVDWEVVGLGDPWWDVASVLADYLNFWIQSIPIVGKLEASQLVRSARYSLLSMQPAMRRFWETYTADSDVDAASRDTWLLRTVRYTAARLIQGAFEQMQRSPELSGNALYELQLSLNMLQRPSVAAKRILGIGPNLSCHELSQPAS